MIIIYHSKKEIIDVLDIDKNLSLKYSSKKLTQLIFELSETYSFETILWCDFQHKEFINWIYLKEIFKQENILSSFSCSGDYIINSNIEYVDNTVFSTPNLEVKFPSYLMSSDIGGVSSIILNRIKRYFNIMEDFDYFLCSLAKIAIPHGVFCYSDPNLLLSHKVDIKNYKTNNFLLFKFVSQHWKKKWLVFLFFIMILKEKKICFIPLIFSLFNKKRKFEFINFESDEKPRIDNLNIDVLIPTIGRREYLEQFLNNLAQQTILPKNVIIIEQNPLLDSQSELDFLEKIVYPFKVLHRFIHKTGACNARNLGLNLVQSDFVFLADDDIRIESDFFESFIKSRNFSPGFAFSFSCLKPDEIKKFPVPIQWETFGGGCSIIPSTIIRYIEFDQGFEHGFGEDSDFGMQIRNLGVDIIYLPEPEIIHHKAPYGGFRSKPKFIWSDELIVPKPSPTVFLFFLKHKTAKQIYSFKISLIIGYFKSQKISNPLKNYSIFNDRWELSKKYALKLLNA